MSKVSHAPTRLATAGRAVGYTVALFTVLALVTFMASDKAVAAFASLPPSSLWLFGGAVVVSNLLRVHRYVVFARRLRLRVSPAAIYLYVVAGMAFIATPGKVGTALRLWLLKQRYQIPYRQSAPMLVMDVLTDFLAMLPLVLLAIGLLGSLAGLGLALVAFMGLLLAVLAVFGWPTLPRAMVKILYQLTGRRRPRAFAGLLRLLSKLKALFGWRTVLAATLLSCLAWALLSLGFYGLVLGLNLPLSLAQVTLVVCAGTMLGALSMLPGGLGGAEATMLALLATFGVPLPTALVLTLVLRIGTLWLPTLVGFIALPCALRHAQHT